MKVMTKQTWVLELNEDEAKYLRDLTQNAYLYDDLEQEPEDQRLIRYEIFKAVEDAI